MQLEQALAGLDAQVYDLTHEAYQSAAEAADVIRKDFTAAPSFPWAFFTNSWHRLCHGRAMADESGRNRASDNGMVVYLVHGLRQSPGAFKPLADMLSALGHRPVAISYHWQRPFADCAAEVADALQHGDNGIAIGHSTGADALRYAAMRGWLPWLQGAIFACPCTNGKIAGLLSRCLFGTAEFYCDQTREESSGILPTLAGKPPMNHVTIAALHDRLVPLASALDMHGMNVVAAGGHMDGTGCQKRFNAVYSACVNYLCDHGSLTKI